MDGRRTRKCWPDTRRQCELNYMGLLFTSTSLSESLLLFEEPLVTHARRRVRASRAVNAWVKALPSA